MSQWRQPWSVIDLDGRRCRLQILDPATAFALEPELVAVLGETLTMACAAPDELIGAVWRHSAAGWTTAQSIRSLASDPVGGPEAAATAIRTLGQIVCSCLIDAKISPAWARDVFGRMVYGRLDVGRRVIVEDSRDYARAGFGPMIKWRIMAAQLRQTFGPLWLRSPYTVRSTSKALDYGVAQPKSVPVAVRWADNLARLGSAGSSREILREWTPVEMIEIVENAAYQAEHERRANDAARSGGG